jgi:hypothetical protein
VGPLLLLLALVAVLVVFGIGLLLQERHPREIAIVYSVEDALSYVWSGIDDATKASLGRADVRRILEWEMHYLQQPDRRTGEAVVAGVEAAAYAQEKAMEQGYGYEPAAIFAVLDLQAEYLASLGAVGGPVEGDATDG